MAEVEAALRARGILVRSMAGKPLIDGSFRLSIGTREQMRRFFGELEEILGLAPGDVAEWPLWVNAGKEQLMVPVTSAEAVRRARPRGDAFSRLKSEDGHSLAYVFHDAGDAAGAVEARFFFPSGAAILEDPATGSACANLGGWFTVIRPQVDVKRTISQGDAVGLNRMGTTGLVMAVVVLLVLFVTGALSESVFLPMMLSAMGGAALTYNALRLPGWALEREAQMERIAARARVLLGAAPGPDDAPVLVHGAPADDPRHPVEVAVLGQRPEALRPPLLVLADRVRAESGGCAREATGTPAQHTSPASVMNRETLFLSRRKPTCQESPQSSARFTGVRSTRRGVRASRAARTLVGSYAGVGVLGGR